MQIPRRLASGAAGCPVVESGKLGKLALQRSDRFGPMADVVGTG